MRVHPKIASGAESIPTLAYSKHVYYDNNCVVVCRLVSLLSQDDCEDELVREAIITLGSFAHGVYNIHYM